MSGINLDINNYTIKDVENLFKLHSNYKGADVELKEYELRTQLLKNPSIDKRYKTDIINFLENAKNLINFIKFNSYREKQPTTITNNWKLDNTDFPVSRSIPSREGELNVRPTTQYIYSNNSDYFPGVLNPLNTRIISKVLTIDTKYRDNYFGTVSSDFTLQLPERINKVVSMQLASIEFPVSFYGISACYGNNFIYIEVSYDDYGSNDDCSSHTSNDYCSDYTNSNCSYPTNSTISSDSSSSSYNIYINANCSRSSCSTDNSYNSITSGSSSSSSSSCSSSSCSSSSCSSSSCSTSSCSTSSCSSSSSSSGCSSSTDSSYNSITSDSSSSNNDSSITDSNISSKNIKSVAYTFVIPDGNYNASDLVKVVNTTIQAALKGPSDNRIDPIFKHIQFLLDLSQSNNAGTGLVWIVAYENSCIQSITLDFTRDINGIPDNVTPLSMKLGWVLGFRQTIYTGLKNYGSDTVIETFPMRYFFLSINDFNNCVNNNFVSAFNKSAFNPNILSRICMKGSPFSVYMENDFNILSEPRNYFGPVDIQRLQIRIYDDQGRIMYMNNADYSFSLILKTLYDL